MIEELKLIALAPYNAKGISDADELLSRTVELHEVNKSLVVANKKLLSRTVELHEVNRSLFESNHELAQVNKELADTGTIADTTREKNTSRNQAGY